MTTSCILHNPRTEIRHSISCVLGKNFSLQPITKTAVWPKGFLLPISTSCKKKRKEVTGKIMKKKSKGQARKLQENLQYTSQARKHPDIRHLHPLANELGTMTSQSIAS